VGKAFQDLPIKTKLSAIMVLIVVAVISVLSFVILQTEKAILQSRLDEIGTYAVRTLSYQAKDPLLHLLLNENSQLQTALIQEAVFATTGAFEGMEYAVVLGRDGKVVAHSNYPPHLRPMDDFAALLNREGFRSRESRERFEYFYRITVGVDSPAVMGLAGVGFSKEVILRPLRKAQRLILGSALAVIGIAVLVIAFLAKRMTNQIQALSEGARQVGQGNLNVKIPVTSRDELGRLAEEFNRTVQLLREKLQMQKFVSKMTLQMIRQRALYEDLPRIGERKKAAILFTDVRYFSLITEHLDPGDVVGLINIYLDLQSRIIEAHGGVVDKFVGDQVMALFDGQDMADRAVAAAIEIQRAIQVVNATRARDGRIPLSVGIGLNCGTVVVGNVGSEDRKDYTAMGHAVNLAAALCASAKPNQIIATMDLVSQLRQNYSTVALSPLAFKGRQPAVEICEIEYSMEVVA